MILFGFQSEEYVLATESIKIKLSLVLILLGFLIFLSYFFGRIFVETKNTKWILEGRKIGKEWSGEDIVELKEDVRFDK